MLFHEQDPDSRFPRDPRHRGEQRLHDDRREAEAQLVDHEELRAPDERAGDGQHLLLATRHQTRRGGR